MLPMTLSIVSDLRNILTQFGESIVTRIRGNMVIKKLMASGETARSIESVVQDDEAGTVLQILSNLALLTLSEPYPYLGIRGGRGRNVKVRGD